ncbi:hypothetical protein DFS34DRAFT_698449 [Phlyctochytrium arcticum]|nr:hypothetical protein DFS34DRAFT_698449 [Phlyctochytrium arcticum]
MSKQKVALSYTGGKDCSLALQILSRDKSVEVARLITFKPRSAKPFFSHPLPLIQLRAQGLDIPHQVLTVDGPDFLGSYVSQLRSLKEEGFDQLATGDIEDVCSDFMSRAAEQAQITLARPLWQVPRPQLLSSLLETYNLSIIISCVNMDLVPEQSARQLVGKVLTRELLEKILQEEGWEKVDACGEFGEYHTMCVDSPLHKYRVDLGQGTIQQEGSFLYWDCSASQKLLVEKARNTINDQISGDADPVF